MWSCIDREFTRPENFSKGFENKTYWFTLSLDQWMYWWWFWFGFLWAFYFMFTIHLLKKRQFKFHSKINTSLRSHSKWGDFFVSVIPLTWTFNIIWHSNLMLRNFENQQHATAFTLKIIGRQWYWIYKYDMDLFSKEYNNKFNIGNNKWVDYYRPLDSSLFNLEVQRVAKLGVWREGYSNLLFSNLTEESDGYLFNDNFFFYKFYNFQDTLKNLNLFFLKKKNKFKFNLDNFVDVFYYYDVKLIVNFMFKKCELKFLFKDFFFFKRNSFLIYLKPLRYRFFFEKNLFFFKILDRIHKHYVKLGNIFYFKGISVMNYFILLKWFCYNRHFDVNSYLFFSDDANDNHSFDEAEYCGCDVERDYWLDMFEDFCEVLNISFEQRDKFKLAFLKFLCGYSKDFNFFVFCYNLKKFPFLSYRYNLLNCSKVITRRRLFFFSLEHLYNLFDFVYKKKKFEFKSNQFLNFEIKFLKFRYNSINYKFIKFPHKGDYFGNKIKIFETIDFSGLKKRFLFILRFFSLEKYIDMKLSLKLKNYSYFLYAEKQGLNRYINFYNFYKKIYNYSYFFFFLKIMKLFIIIIKVRNENIY